MEEMGGVLSHGDRECCGGEKTGVQPASR
jgi:hypothetical protein